jgi:hypothetical protein
MSDINGRFQGRKRRGAREQFKSRMRQFLETPAGDGEFSQALSDMGFSDADINNELVLLYSVYKKALDGNIQAFHAIQNLLGIDDGARALEIKTKELKLKTDAAKNSKPRYESERGLMKLIEGLKDDE